MHTKCVESIDKILCGVYNVDAPMCEKQKKQKERDIMKYCTQCGAQNRDEAVVCVACGTDFAPVQAQPMQQMHAPQRPVCQLKTNRGLLKYILLGLITFGIYPLVVMSTVSTDINTIASRYDGKNTMHFCLVAFLFSWLTFGIVPLVWYNNISSRIGLELTRRGIGYPFGAGTYWGWCFFGVLLFGIGPFVYMYKLFHAMNLLAADYNVKG